MGKRTACALFLGVVYLLSLVPPSPLQGIATGAEDFTLCAQGFLIGAGFRKDGETERGDKTAEAKRIQADADAIGWGRNPQTGEVEPGVLISGWGMRKDRIKILVNSDAKKTNIKDGFRDVLLKLDPVPKHCTYYHVKIHIQGHGTRGNPSRAKDLIAKDPADQFQRVAFRAWDNQQFKDGEPIGDEPEGRAANDGLLYDFELWDKVLELRNALKKQHEANPKQLVNYQVIVQVDSCFAEALLKKLIKEKNISTAWSTGAECKQKYELNRQSPFTKGFVQAFQATPHPSVEEAHKSAVERVKDHAEEKGFDAPKADYAPRPQNPAIHPKWW